MRFVMGQKWRSIKAPHKTAEVTQLRDDAREACVDRRDENGALINSAWVRYDEFSQHWALGLLATYRSVQAIQTTKAGTRQGWLVERTEPGSEPQPWGPLFDTEFEAIAEAKRLEEGQ